ncbi:hypothetical protein PR202_gb22855 [Eleusine coracana subsp. coracana]|uniref:Disease resistance R13L4/SHOC-2-like LRR domain-containing protein n=1 Tax=Eleusine coracana subsp. coracana TaxID=191504 RepID=A0AAV5FGS2_ELECO|nr:hypothetical protein PR202_gb22855 [Eleusine coracana subsp. coracana]
MLKLPGRLDELLQRYSHMLPNGAEDEIPLIKGDLEKIIAFLQKSEEDHAAAIVKCWTKEEGEITRRRIPRHRIIRWRRSKTPYLPEKLRQRLWMANKIREFSERVQEALERHSMYNNLRACSTASCRNPDPCFGARHPTLAVDVDDVHNHVGVGKINLANQLYNRLRHRFECRAFVRVSQKPDMRRIFITILSQNLSMLTNLQDIRLTCRSTALETSKRIVIGKDGFSVLKHFKLKSCDPWLKFEMDAMSNLQKLKLGFNARRGDQRTIMPVGMERLSGLKEVSVKIGGATSPEASDRRTAESAFRDAIRLHARCPRVTILYVNEIIGSMDDETSIKREENYARYAH